MDWEKEFDEFAEDCCIDFISDGGDEDNLYLSETMGYDKLKHFIRSQRSQLLKSLIREVNNISFNDENCEVDGCHFDLAIDDVLSLLEKYEADR